MALKIFTDSGCDFPMELFNGKVHIVPLHVTFNEGTYLDRVDLSTADFYQKMREQEELPKTAAPSPYSFLEKFQKELEQGDEGIIISLSSQLSSTFQNARIAVEMYKEINPQAKLEVLDSKNASIGMGVIISKALDFLHDTIHFEEVTQRIREVIDRTYTLIFLDTLENVIKGGRLDRVKGKIASVLNIKILMKNSFEGSLEIIDKVRGSKQALNRLFELVDEYGGNIEQRVLAIAHANCEEKAQNIKRLFEEKYQEAKIVLTEIGPSIGTYSGEGGILISF